jgi:uncharacterized protein
MPHDLLIPLTLGVLAVAFLYSSVGHAGASGYIAVMSLFSLAPDFIKPTALALNILVASLAAWQFRRAGHFSWRLFWPFALPAIPMAFLGGYINLPTRAFEILIGIVLLFSAVRFMVRPSTDAVRSDPSRPAALASGAALGLLAGLTGTGGGIFLTPLLLIMRWAHAKTAAAVSAVFILMNSIAGLLGNVSSTGYFPVIFFPLAAAAVVGGSAGSYLGSWRFEPVMIKRMLAVVLLIAGAKLILAS